MFRWPEDPLKSKRIYSASPRQRLVELLEPVRHDGGTIAPVKSQRAFETRHTHLLYKTEDPPSPGTDLRRLSPYEINER